MHKIKAKLIVMNPEFFKKEDIKARGFITAGKSTIEIDGAEIISPPMNEKEAERVKNSFKKIFMKKPVEPKI